MPHLTDDAISKAKQPINNADPLDKASSTAPKSYYAKQRMVEAAAILLIDQGPQSITLRKVARAAGVPIGSANYWFPNKDDLYSTAVFAAEELRSKTALQLAESLTVQARTSVEIANLLIKVWFAPHVGPDVLRARLEPMLDAQNNAELSKIMAKSRLKLLNALEIVFQNSLLAAPRDLDLIAHLMDATLLYASSLGNKDPIPYTVDVLSRVIEATRKLTT